MIKALFIFLLLTSLVWGEDCSDCSVSQSKINLPEVPLSEWPIEFVKVHKVKYERNENSDYCTRPTEMVDTIVIHHSQTFSTSSPEEMNDIHLNNGWYMVGYSYSLNSPYTGNSRPEARVTEARPIEMVGAHAGSKAFVKMDELQKQMWNQGKVKCGLTGQEFKVDPEMVKDGKIKANVTTIGMVVIGNYSPFSIKNPDGYVGKVRNPSQDTLKLVAKMSCQLQKKYPRMKSIKWHSYYNATLCPGTIRKYIEQIKKLTKEYGCEFN